MKKSAKVLGITILSVILVFLCSCGQQNDKTAVGDQICTLTIKCDTILENMDKLSPEKKDIIPENGSLILAESISFAKGENLLDILKRELKSRKIHIDFEKSQSTGSAYVRGIANIYAGDCGELSGWMIRVNGEDLIVGCDDYFPQNEDVIEWLYTCDMGNDL